MALKTGRIRQTTLVDAKPEAVYAALAEPRRHSAFTKAKARGTARKGGAFTAFNGYISGTYLELKKGRRMVMAWRTAAWPEGYPPSRLELRFEPAANGTRLTMIQTKVPAIQVAKYRRGWIANYWDPLKAHFARKARRAARAR